jgi:hypothetical protein
MGDIDFTFKPMSPITEELEWLTPVAMRYSGTEQRIMARPSPRHKIEVIVPARDGAKGLLSSTAYVNQHLLFNFPIWQESTVLNYDVDSTDSVLVFNTAYADYTADGRILVWANYNHYVIADISSVAAGQVNISGTVGVDFPSGSIVAPVRDGKLVNVFEEYDTILGNRFFRLIFEIRENIVHDSYSASLVKDGMPVIDKKMSIRSNTRTVTVTRDAHVIDGGIGLIEEYYPLQWPRKEITQATFVLDSKAAIWDFRLLLHYLKGKLNPVFVPMMTQDIIIVGIFGSSDTTLDIENIGYTENLADSVAHSYLFFKRKTGQVIMKKILGSSWTTGSDTEELVIESGLGFEGSNDSFTCVSFMAPCRLTSDIVKINWIRNDLAEVSIDFTVDQELPVIV